MKFSVSASLVFIAFLCTLSLQMHPEYGIFGMNTWFIEWREYDNIILQFILYSFFHAWWLHWVSNSIFVLIFGNIVETLMWRKKYLFFWIFSTLFNGIFLMIFSWGNTIGMSGFAVSILTYYTILLYTQKNPEYKWWVTAIAINIIVWFTPWISLIWHLAGALSGAVCFFLSKKRFKQE